MAGPVQEFSNSAGWPSLELNKRGHSTFQGLPVHAHMRMFTTYNFHPFIELGGAAWRFPIVRASNEGLLRPRVARAQGIARPPFFPFFSLYSSFQESYWREWPRLPSTARIGRALFHRARSASKKGCLAAPCPVLASPSSTPVQYGFLVTPWLSDSFSSFRDSAQMRRRNQISHEN